MLTYLSALSAGHAIRLYTALAPGAAYMRVLRKSSDDFTGPTDSAALTVVDDFADAVWVDYVEPLADGVPVFYRCYDRAGSTWVDQGWSLSVVPATRWIDDKLDPQEVLRDRVAFGIAAEIARGTLVPASGAIRVTTAPFALAEGVSLPTVSVHLESTGPDVRGIGDELQDFYDPGLSEYIGSEGWVARYALTVAGVSLNPDERIALRKALRRVIQVNMEVFADAGMALIEFHQTDSEQFSENNAPLYFTNGAFSCVAPAFVRIAGGRISDLTITETSLNPTTGQPYP